MSEEFYDGNYYNNDPNQNPVNGQPGYGEPQQGYEYQEQPGYGDPQQGYEYQEQPGYGDPQQGYEYQEQPGYGDPQQGYEYQEQPGYGDPQQDYGYQQPGYGDPQGYGPGYDPNGYQQPGYGDPQGYGPGYDPNGYGMPGYGGPQGYDPNGYADPNGYPEPDDNDDAEAESSKAKVKWIIAISVILVVLIGVTIGLVLHFQKKSAQEAYRDLLTDLQDDPKSFFADIKELNGYDMSELSIGEDEFSITDTDDDSVPELIINVTSPGKENSFALVYDYTDDDGAQLRGVMAANPQFYTNLSVLTKSDSNDREVTLIEKYNSGTGEYVPLVRYYESDDSGYYEAEQYDRNAWGSSTQYTYNELTDYINENYLDDVEMLVLDYEKINVGNISSISTESSIVPKTQETEEASEAGVVSPDYDMFVNTFPGVEYDCNSSGAGEKALQFLIEGYFGSATYFVKPSEYSTVNSVPGVSNGGFSSYTKYKADTIDGLVKSVFNTTAPSHRSSYEYQNGEVYAYYADGYYYAGIPGGHDGPTYEVKSHTEGSDGIYTITVSIWDESESDDYFTVRAKPAEISGKSAWLFYSITEEEQENQQGILKGTVLDSDGKPIRNATVSAYSSDGTVKATAKTDASGQYELTVDAGTYNVTASADDYESLTKRNINAHEGETAYVEEFRLVSNAGDESYTVKGTIIDASTGNGISGVSIRFTASDNSSYSARTDSSGKYSTSLPAGYYVATITKDGYIDSQFNVISSEETIDRDQNSEMSQVMESDTYRIVLTWGENPDDLDSHMTGPTTDGSTFHIYFSNKSSGDGTAELDLDDTTSYGPETITVTPDSNGTYNYYVHRYGGSGYISTSGAVVKVYRGNNLVATYYAPTDQGTGDYWNVFSITNGTLRTINTVGDSRPS